MFEGVRSRLEALRAAPAQAAAAAAPRIQAKLRADSTTQRGNVPSFGKFGDIPSVAVASDNAIEITCADWVMRQVEKRGQVSSWMAIALDELRAAASREP